MERHVIDRQYVELQSFGYQGRLLDIGGGGEGIIGQLLGNDIFAIDIRRSELDEAPPGPIKIVMDARCLAFPDQTFEVVTAFYSLMYMDRGDHEQVFSQIARVLKPGGIFLVWDNIIPPYRPGDKEIYMIPLEIKIDDRTIKTGYGTRWENRRQNCEYFVDLAEMAGLQYLASSSSQQNFYIRFWRPMEG
nr:methyltransferase domain-containing protein [candidate division Zixibacteria bacterium]